MDQTNDGLRKAIADRDIRTVRYFVADQRNLLLSDWQDGSLERIRHTLQKSLQKSHRVKRQSIASENEIPYELGVWEGWIQAFRTLYDIKTRETEILKAYSADDSNISAIIEYLSHQEQPMRHEELAAALGVTYGELTNSMKALIRCGAVSASGTGKNTRYVLTLMGRQCWTTWASI